MCRCVWNYRKSLNKSYNMMERKTFRNKWTDDKWLALLIILYTALYFERRNKIIFRNITYESRSYIIFHESDIHEFHGNDLCAKYFCQSREKEEEESPFRLDARSSHANLAFHVQERACVYSYVYTAKI